MPKPLGLMIRLMALLVSPPRASRRFCTARSYVFGLTSDSMTPFRKFSGCLRLPDLSIA